MANFSIFCGLSQETRDRLYANLSLKPYCSNNPWEQGLLIRPKETAFTYAYLQINNHWSDTYLIFDVDRGGAALAWEDADILAPTFCTITPQNGHAHLVYELKTPVWKNASPKPIKWMKSIKRDFTSILGADTGYTGLISKNPNHKRWYVLDFGCRHELVELSESAEMYFRRSTPPSRFRKELAFLGESNFLFNDGRFYAYWVVCQCASRDELHDKVITHLENACFNRNEPIRRTRIKYTASFIASWVWERRDHFFHSGRHRRETKDDEELRERHIAGAHKTNAIREAATEEKIRKAIDKFLREGRRITKAAIAREAGISREAVSRYYSHLFPKV